MLFAWVEDAGGNVSEDVLGGDVYFQDDNLPVLRSAEGIGCTNTPSVKIEIRADDNDGIGLSHAYVEEAGYDPTTIYFSSCELRSVYGDELIHYYRLGREMPSSGWDWELSPRDKQEIFIEFQ